MANRPDLATCPFCGGQMKWIDTSHDFTAERFLCGVRCTNQYCVARITFDYHNYTRSSFAKKFNRRVPIGGEQVDKWTLVGDYNAGQEEPEEEENDTDQSAEVL